MALDGGSHTEGGVWAPLPADQLVNRPRLDGEVRLEESETVAMLALIWQTSLGHAGARAYLDAGAGVAGQVRIANMIAARISTARQAAAA